MSNKKSKHVYIALDSDVLSNLFDLNNLKDIHNDWGRDEILKELAIIDKHSPVIKNIDTYLSILEMMKVPNAPIRFLVTTTPFRETTLKIAGMEDFIRKFCYVPNVKDLEDEQYNLEIRELAQAYCSSYYVDVRQKDGTIKREFRNAPMKDKYSSYAGKKVPENDAYAIAEATKCGACLLTENEIDFIEKKSKYYGMDRSSLREFPEKGIVRGIVEINRAHGYGQKNSKSKYGKYAEIIPKPILVRLFGVFLKDIEHDLNNYPLTEDERVQRHGGEGM